jgi:hypothetical protein
VLGSLQHCYHMGNDLDDLKSTVARAAITMRTWRGTSILLPAQDERELAAEVIRQEINEIVSALELISDFLVLLKGLGPPSEIAPEDWAMWHTKLVAGLRLMGREVYHGLYTVKEALEVWGSRPPLSSPLLAPNAHASRLDRQLPRPADPSPSSKPLPPCRRRSTAVRFRCG